MNARIGVICDCYILLYTHVDGDAGQLEDKNRRLLLRYVAVELVAVLVPLDRVEDDVVQVEVADEPDVLAPHHVLRYHQLHHSQAIDPCNMQEKYAAQLLVLSFLLCFLSFYSSLARSL